MANGLTGDFDVVAEFSVPAANRVLAAMHRGNRFPHSLSPCVDERPPRTLVPHVPLLASVVNKYGDAIADPGQLVEASGRAQTFLPAASLASAGDQLVNVEWIGGIDREPLAPIQTVGVAQLQLSPPKIEIDPQSDTRITLRTQMRVRYFAAPGSRKLPEFMRGEIQTTVNVDQVASQVGKVIEVNLKAGSTTAVFAPVFTPAYPPTQAEYDVHKPAINKAIQKAVTTSFQPSNVVLPSETPLRVKTLAGAPEAICVLLNKRPASGDPDSVGTVFLGNDDDFAFAVSSDYVVKEFQRNIDKVLKDDLQLRQFPFGFKSVSKFLGVVVARIELTWTISLDTVTVEVKDGEILLTIDGQGLTEKSQYNFSFRARQAFTLKLEGDTAGLEPKGDLDLNVPTGGLTGLMINHFKGNAVSAFRQRRDLAISRVQPAVRSTLSAQNNLGQFLKSLMNPVSPKEGPAADELTAALAYTAFEIKPAALILHGSLDVPPWPPAHVEFDLTPWTAGTGTHEYSALNSWIPGGTVDSYTWRLRGKPQPLPSNPNSFVYPPSTSVLTPFERAPAAIQQAMLAARGDDSPALSGVNSICLTVKGKRLPASGPGVEEDVSATSCGWAAIPLTILPDTPRLSGAVRQAALATGRASRHRLPDVALTQATASGALEVVGHASPWVPPNVGPGRSPNLIVHFPDERSAADLGFLTEAVRQSGRNDAATAIVAVLPHDALARTRPREGLIVTDDPDGAWNDLFGVERPPLTVLVGPSGDVRWRHDGDPAIAQLAPALREHLVAGGIVVPGLLKTSARIGQPPPNFIFTYAAGRELTLRKLIGQPVVLVFWKSSSPPSVDTFRRLSDSVGKDGGRRPLVLAIHDGELAEGAERVASNGAPAVITVPDAAGRISLSYGVRVWPTTIFIDASGVVREVQYGRLFGGLFGPEAGYPGGGRRAD